MININVKSDGFGMRVRTCMYKMYEHMYPHVHTHIYNSF